MNNPKGDDPASITYSQFVSAFESYREDHAAMLAVCTGEGNAPISAQAHLVVAALRRSAALIEGFLLLCDARNQFCAMPLVRLQLDSAMRVHACQVVPDAEDFVQFILQGEEPRKYTKVRKLKVDLSDSALHKQLEALYAETSSLYREFSGYIHLSRAHLFGVCEWGSLKSRVVAFSEHDQLPPWDEADMKGTMVCMLWATESLTEECKKLLKQISSE